RSAWSPSSPSSVWASANMRGGALGRCTARSGTSSTGSHSVKSSRQAYISSSGLRRATRACACAGVNGPVCAPSTDRYHSSGGAAWSTSGAGGGSGGGLGREERGGGGAGTNGSEPVADGAGPYDPGCAIAANDPDADSARASPVTTVGSLTVMI